MAKTLDELKAEKAAIVRRIRREASKKAADTRKAQTRQKIIIGGALAAGLFSGQLRLCVAKPDGGWALAGADGDGDLALMLERYVTRPTDRAAVGLPPLP